MEMPKVKIANFEGPFDLLLHLIKKNEMDIYNVEIYKITNQYLRYLEEMKTIDLEITSEFIVVAATLIEIKSKKLLPKVKEKEESEEDIEKDLLEKLIEYKKIKQASNYLRERFISLGDIYTKKPEIIEDLNEEKIDNNVDIFKNITLLDLYNIYNKLIEGFLNKKNIENKIEKNIFVDKYKIEDKMQELIDKIKSNEIFKFKEIIDTSECKLETVVTFLAILELIKLRIINVYQENNFEDILIEKAK